MKFFSIYFYYFTDLRHHEKYVRARTAVAALVKVTDENPELNEWCGEPGFYINIKTEI